MNFKNAVNTTKEVKKTSQIPISNKKILIDDVIVYIDDKEENKEETYSNIVTFEDLLNLLKKHPNYQITTNPPLYSSFTTKNNRLETYVLKGDTVVYKDKKFSPTETIEELEVTELNLKSLRDMTVVIAILSNNDFCLTTHLKKI